MIKNNKQKIGFIGLGRMGSGIAANLLRVGHDVTVYNRTAEKARPLVEKGAHQAASVAEACHGKVVITMLADDSAVEKVVFDQGGILENLGKNAVHISMSTISIALSERLATAHEQAGQRFVSAPVFGRPDSAAQAKLFLIAAGQKDAFTECSPLFEAVSQKHFHLSEKPTDANVVKLSGNFLIASIIEGLGEAMALVAKAGIDRHRYLDILTSTLFSAPLFKTYGETIANGKFEPAGFAAPLGEKDIRLTLGAAETLRVPMPMASLAHDRLLTLLARGGEKLDWSALGELAARDAGLVMEER